MITILFILVLINFVLLMHQDSYMDKIKKVLEEQNRFNSVMAAQCVELAKEIERLEKKWKKNEKA